MNNTLITFLTMACLLAGPVLLPAQYEKEPVEAFRVTTDFHTPPVTLNETGISSINAQLVDEEQPVAYVSPDSFGVHFNAPDALWKMLMMHVNQNGESETAQGFRIQIYAGSSLESANDAKADFLESFDDDFPIYQVWNPPHFRVRVGDFLSRNAAMREVATLRQIFPDAFIVSDQVKLPKYKDRSRLLNPEEVKVDGRDDSAGSEN